MLKASGIIVATFLWLMVHQPARAQYVPSVKGFVSAADSKPLEAIPVLLKSGIDSSLVKTTLTTKTGGFEFTAIAPGKYFIEINRAGYRHLLTPAFEISAHATLDAGVLLLHPVARTFKEIAIVQTRPLIETRSGKVILNTGNSALFAGASVFELLQKAPGVQVDQNDGIRLNGRTGVLITIDGKNTHLQPAELNNLLHATQSGFVEQIELISNPSAAYDAAGGGGVINIKLKKSKTEGTNGTLTLNTGMSDLGKGFRPNYRYNPGISINNRRKNLNLFGSYAYADQTSARTSYLDRNIYLGSNQSNIVVDYFSEQQRQSHTYRLGADYNLDKLNLVGILVNGTYSGINLDKLNVSDVSNGPVIRADAVQDRSISNTGINLNYKGSYKGGREFTADLDYSVYHRRSEELLVNEYFNIMSKQNTNPLQLSNNSPGDYTIRSAKIDYSFPMQHRARFASGLKISRVQSKNVLDFGEIIHDIYHPDPQFASRFTFNENIISGYGTYSRDFKKGNLLLGLRAEKTGSTGIQTLTDTRMRRNYLNLFPNLQFTYLPGKQHKLLFAYGRRIDRPLYEDLNQYLGYLDQYSYRSGNPYLLPSLSHNAELTHTYKQKYTATLSASFTRNFSWNVFEQNDTTRIVTQIRRNLDKQSVYGLTLNAPLQLIKNRWDASVNVQALYVAFRSFSAGGDLNQGARDITFTVQNSFNLGKGFTAELLAKYETPSFYGISSYRAIYYADAGLGKSLFNKRATLRLRVSDIFNSTVVRFRSNYRNLDLYDREKQETRLAVVNFSLNLGKSTVGAARKRMPGSDAEQRRLSQ